MSRDFVVLVDTNDNVIGSEEKLLAHQKGLLHRAFSIFIARQHQGETQVLLQQRAWSKYHCGGLWSNSCCSHPQPEEELKSSALARLNEELGFTLEDLTWVDSHTYRAELANELVEHELDHLFVAWAEPDVSQFNPSEVEATSWRSLAQIDEQLASHPQQFTPWFAPTYEKVRASLN
mgnify:CR=1 FL=1